MIDDGKGIKFRNKQRKYAAKLKKKSREENRN